LFRCYLKKYSPIRETGDGLQGVYLAEISQELAEKIFELGGTERTDEKPKAAVARQKKKQSLFAQRVERELRDDQIEKEIEDSPHLGETEKKGVTTSRRGQGKFKKNVMRRGPRCRVTGVSEPHLIASHIKPWSVSTNEERIDGNNGLMLAPHIDHLFNYGFISFEDDGTLLISSSLDTKVFTMWKLDSTLNVGPFTSEQSHYLAYHRTEIFEK
jgi:putative restriction endonuclease